jgi:AhpD family alkylhydroperoxidase
MRGETLPVDFRERLMLVVTQVNACRYCAYYHAREALAAGLSEAELQQITAGDFESSPPAERPALLYAQHWAESDADPDPQARARLVELYGDAAASAIDLALSVIRVGNLSGNTFDALLYRLSFGRLPRSK